MFFSFDGVDGSGKSTQVRLFCQWLEETGVSVVQCRDPGGTPLGEAIRGVLLGTGDTKISPTSEMLLYMAARAQLVQDVIAPALDAGKVVVSDRYLLANVVYQGYAGGLDVDWIWRIGRMITRGIEPTVTFVLDLADSAAAARLARPLDRMENRGASFREALRRGYLEEARKDPVKFVVIDASRSVAQVRADIRANSEGLLKVVSAGSGARARSLEGP